MFVFLILGLRSGKVGGTGCRWPRTHWGSGVSESTSAKTLTELIGSESVEGSVEAHKKRP